MNRQLLEKYFNNECSQDEVRQILVWINSFESEKSFSKEFKTLWQNELYFDKQMDWQKAWINLQDKIEMEELIHSLPVKKSKKVNVKTQNSIRNFAIAAVFSLIVLSLAALYYFSDSTNNLKTESITSIEQVQKSTEKGQKLTIHLEDGSKVMLNAQSSLQYPIQFTDSLRELWLQGEAYFDVVNDPQRSFVVHTGDITTTALGTSFNINAYPEKDEYRVALTSGQVVVGKDQDKNKMLLEPGKMAVYKKEANKLSSLSFSVMEIAWKDGVIYFDNASFEEIISTLERWYGVVVIINGNPRDQKWEFSGKFRNETLSNILEALQFAHDFNYELERKTVYLNF